MQEKVFKNKGNLIIGIYGPLNIQNGSIIQRLLIYLNKNILKK